MNKVLDITQEHKKRQAYRLALKKAQEIQPCKCTGECKCGTDFMADFLRALHGTDNKAPSDQ